MFILFITVNAEYSSDFRQCPTGYARENWALASYDPAPQGPFAPELKGKGNTG